MFTVKRTQKFSSKHNYYQSSPTFQQHNILLITQPSNPLRSSGDISKIIVPPQCSFVITLFFSYSYYFRQKWLGDIIINLPKQNSPFIFFYVKVLQLNCTLELNLMIFYLLKLIGPLSLQFNFSPSLILLTRREMNLPSSLLESIFFSLSHNL